MKKVVWLMLGLTAVFANAQAREASGVLPAKPAGGEHAHRTAPSEKEILSWWNEEANGGIEIGKPVEIRLLNHEVAYLASATFEQAGRNNMFGAVLIRPKLKEVADVRGAVGNQFEVYDLDNDGVSEIVTGLRASGQGSFWGADLIIMFDGSTPVELYREEWESGPDDETEEPPGGCVVDGWKFTQKSATEKFAKFIKEACVREETPGKAVDGGQVVYKKVVTTYKFVNKKFIKLGD